MRRIVFLLILCSAVFSPNLYAQETTATLTGSVSDATGAIVIGATVTVKHEPTGYITSTQTNSKGRFVVPNLKPGGPYTITISYIGLKEEKLTDINLTLGDNPDLNTVLKSSAADLKEVIVSSSGRRTSSSGLTVNAKQLTTLPSIGRSLSDFTRLTPQSNNNSFAGTNFRYNNVTLDGAINNDAIGFSNSFGGVSGGGQSGTAGAGTRTNPYSLDVIQEVQVQLTPYDVKLGNFTGGSVNAVTKSGSNIVHGSVYGYGRNQALVGKSVDGLKTNIGSDFYDYQYGGTISGPIIKNKLFFIVNGEITRRQEPTFYNAGDPGAAITVADAQKIVDFMKSSYNYDAGTYDKYKIFTKSDKVFARLDWNIDAKSTLTFRTIYTNGSGNNLERSSNNFQFSSTDFTQHTKNLNMVAELKSKISNTVNNQVILSYINVHEYREFPGTLAPFIDISGGKIWLGTWREASVYNQKQKTFEFTDNLTVTKGNNKFTFGTHNEFYDLHYNFINSYNGRIEYSNGIDKGLLLNQPTRIRGAYTFDDSKNNRDDLYNNAPGNHYKVNLFSVYAQDEISISRRFKITPGIRVDYSSIPNQPALDPALTATPDYTSANPTYTHTSFSQLNNKWLGKASLSPRLGFSFDIKGDQSLVLRGGSGIFVGRMPFAWLGYAYTLSGTTYGNIDWNNIQQNGAVTVPLSINPAGLKDTVTKYGGASRASTHEVDIVDNNFKLPTIWRSNIALDIKFGKGYKLTLDAMYTKSLYDVKFQQINIKDSASYYTSGPTQTPVYPAGGKGKLNSAFSNVYLLTNTKEGYRYNLTAQLSKASNNIRVGAVHALNLNWSVAYTYGVSKDISNGIRNSFQSNYELNPAIVPGNASLAYSNFDLRHRIVATASFNFLWNEHHATSLSFFYAGQSGSPYTVVYSNGSAAFNNAATVSLPFIPADPNQQVFADKGSYTASQQLTDFNTFVDGDKYLKTRRGQYAERNALHTPWNHQLDMKLMHEFKFSKTKSLQLSFDVVNVLNLLSNSWGHVFFVSNTNNYNVNLLTFANDAGGHKPGTAGYVPTYNFNPPPSTGTTAGKYYTVDPINSRFQGQFGIKYIF